MSYQEKKSIVSLISTLLIFGTYSLYIFQQHSAEIFAPAAFSFWASVILILIPVSIAAKIVINIVFNIIHRMATNEQEPAFMDELDKLIELKSTRNSHYVFVFGFLLSMGSLAMNMPVYVMFMVLILSGLLSEIAGVITTLYFYRKGIVR